MTQRYITVTRSRLVEMRWETQGQIRGGLIDPPPELYHLWCDGQLLGFASTAQAALLMAEQFAQANGLEVDDAIWETTTPEERPVWSPPPPGQGSSDPSS